MAKENNQALQLELEQESLALKDRVEALTVEDVAGMEVANSLRVSAKRTMKRIEEILITPFREAVRGLQKKIQHYDSLMLEPLRAAVLVIDQKMGAYYQRQRLARQEAETKAKEETKRKAEDIQLAAALQAEQLGLKTLAQNIIDRPVDVPPVVVTAPAPPKLEGTGTRMDWKWRTTDKAKIPLEFLAEDTVRINAEIRAKRAATGGVFSEQVAAMIPGIEVYEKPVFIDRSGKG